MHLGVSLAIIFCSNLRHALLPPVETSDDEFKIAAADLRSLGNDGTLPASIDRDCCGAQLCPAFVGSALLICRGFVAHIVFIILHPLVE